MKISPVLEPSEKEEIAEQIALMLFDMCKAQQAKFNSQKK